MSAGAGGKRIVIAGAGSIGCYVGGVLAHGGADVRFLGRRRIIDVVGEYGLTVTDLTGASAHLGPDDVAFSDKPEMLSDADIILVCVKSSATAEMASLISSYAPPSAIVVSLQNGVANASTLRKALPGYDVRAGMVAYNVVNAGEGRFHRGVSGHIIIEDGPSELAQLLSAFQLEIVASTDIRAVQWGKLLINLNNALNALAGIPLRDEILDHGWRSLLADQIAETLPALKAEGVEPRSATPLPTRWLPQIMRLPTPLYKLVAARNLKIDPEARSSMWEDLQQGRKTEIDELQGAVVALCRKHNLSAPVSAQVAAMIKQCEKNGGGSPNLKPQDVRAEIS